MHREDETITAINDGLRLIQKKEGLQFGTDALLLAGFIRRQRSARAVDFGSGSGIISLLCATRDKFASIRAVEVQNDYADLIARNVALNGFGDRIEVVAADVRDLAGEEVDVVFSNPPYMRADSGFAGQDVGRQIARHEVCGDIGDFCVAASRLLKFGGLFYVVYRPDRLVDLLCALRKSHLEPKRMRFVFADEDHGPSLVLIEAKKGAKPSLVLPRPLYLRRGGEESEEIRAMYESGDLYD